MDTTVVLRFLHICGAAIGLGGLVAAWAVLPRLAEDSREIAARQIGKWTGIGLTVSVIAGILNAAHQLPLHAQGYHTLLAVKASLGLIVFVVAALCFHPAPIFKAFSRRRQLWLAFLIPAMLVVYALGAVLRVHYAPLP